MTARHAAALAAFLVLLCPAAAGAATQTITDPDDGVAETSAPRQLDIRTVELSQGGGDTWVDVTVEEDTRTEWDAIWVGFDTDFDGRGDYVARLRGFGDTSAVLEVMAGDGSTTTCLPMGATQHDDGSVAVAGPSGGMQLLELHFPTSAIGGAEDYRWAVYAQNDSQTGRSSYDYAPDGANPDTGRPNPATQNEDGCDADGDGVYGESGDPQTTTAIPIELAGGVVHGAAPSGGHGGGSGSSGDDDDDDDDRSADEQRAPAPVPAAVPAPISPLQYVRTGGVTRMPDLRPGSRLCRGGCTEEQARQILGASGLGAADIVFVRDNEVPRAPRRLRSLTDDGEVFAQSVPPRRRVDVPDMAAIRFLYAKPPEITLTVYRDKDLEFGCDDAGLEGKLEDQAWPGVSTGRGTRRTRGSLDLLEKDLKCNVHVIRYLKADDVTAPTIGRAEVKGSRRVNLTIKVPRGPQELAIQMSDLPGHPGFHGRDVAGLDSEPDVTSAGVPVMRAVMPVTRTGLGGFVVSVFYTHSAPTQEVRGAKVHVYDGDGSLAASATTNDDGQAALYGHFWKSGKRGRIVATLPVGEQGWTFDGEQPLKVVAGAQRYRAFGSGRWIERKDGIYRTIRVGGDAAARSAAVGCRGFDERGNTFIVTDVEALADQVRSNHRQAMNAKSAAARRFWLDSVFAGMGTLIRAGAADRQEFTDLVTDIDIGPATVGGGTTPQGSCNLSQADVDTLLLTPSGTAAGPPAKGYTLSKGGVPTLSGAGWTQLPDGGYIHTSIGNDATLIGQAGGNLIGQAGGNLIGQAGGNLIGQAGGNLISDKGVGLIGQAGGNLIGQAGGNLIGQAGGN